MEKSIKGTQTEKNLITAIASESFASNKYTWFAKQAKKDGYEQISGIFLETAEHERAHAKRLFRLLEDRDVKISTDISIGKISDTLTNLQQALAGETEEYTQLYPEYARIAEEEGFKSVASAFKAVANAETTHARRFQKLISSIQDGRVFEREEAVNWYCRKCGFVHKGKKPPKNCPACNHPQGYFEEEAVNY